MMHVRQSRDKPAQSQATDTHFALLICQVGYVTWLTRQSGTEYPMGCTSLAFGVSPVEFGTFVLIV
jgi:hypothetical protein